MWRPSGPDRVGSLNILIVDDQLSQLRLMSLLLQQAFPDCQTCEVQVPTEVVDLVKVTDFDCVLVDYHMPDLNGVGLATQLRGLKPHLPIILCTAAGDEMLVAEAMTHGITQYLPKGRINPESLRRTVVHAVQIMARERLIFDQQQELEHFSYALAHDFKQPIRQIKTFSQLIISELGDGDSQSIRTHAEFLSNAAGRLSRLVDVMSQYALLGKAPDLVEVKVETVMLELEQALQPYVREHKAKLDFEGSAIVKADKTLIFQILQNLVVNGFTYNMSAAPRVSVQASCKDDLCTIRVKDNGIGIPAEFLERIFQPLMRLHGEAEYEGSGLGLALARKASMSLGGSIRCESAVGVGSEFFVVLPAAAA